VITADRANGPGSWVSAIGGGQWGGDYIASGVTGISLHLINLGNTLTIRLLFEDPNLGPPPNEGVSNTGIFPPVGSGWVHSHCPLHIHGSRGDGNRCAFRSSTHPYHECTRGGGCGAGTGRTRSGQYPGDACPRAEESYATRLWSDAARLPLPIGGPLARLKSVT
jgi:hypothetical protein